MITSEDKKDKSFENNNKSFNDVTNEIVEAGMDHDESNVSDNLPDPVLNIKSTLIKPKEEAKKYGNRLIENCK